MAKAKTTAKKTATAPKKKVAKKSVAKKTATKKAPVKKAAAPKAAAAKKAPAKKAPAKKAKRTITPEERYQMIQTAAYFRAQNGGFCGDPASFWAEAEKEVDSLLAKRK